jgi:hypothetical protein
MFGADGNFPDDTVMYHDLVDKGYNGPNDRGPMITAYAQILRLIAQDTTGTVLIHCSHGMDRTGTVMDLLYNILGVSESDILHDYLLSNTQLSPGGRRQHCRAHSNPTSPRSTAASTRTCARPSASPTRTSPRRARTCSSRTTRPPRRSPSTASRPPGCRATSGATITDPQTALAAGDVTVTTTNPNATASTGVGSRRPSRSPLRTAPPSTATS